MDKVSTGSNAIDALLDGGLEKDVITTFYGPAGSGKSNIALSSTVSVAKSGKKVIYIDTEGGFSIERIKQLSGNLFDRISNNILVFEPTSFQEQKKYIFRTYDYVKKQPNSIGLIIIDSISMLYRLELGEEEARQVNVEFGRQMQILSTISRKYNIPVLVTNQVYSPFDSRDSVEVVGGDIPKYWSKCIVELKIIEPGIREAILRKHRYLPEGRRVRFKITNEGLILIQNSEFQEL